MLNSRSQTPSAASPVLDQGNFDTAPSTVAPETAATGSFDTLGLAEPLLRAVKAEGYTVPTPIQLEAIPHLVAGRDLLGVAQTGTGKTAAFALPILHRLSGTPTPRRARSTKVLVLTPTRELAIQVEESFRTYGKHLQLRTAVIFGGVGQGPQVNALQGGVDILVATPGRLLDLMGQGHVSYDGLTVLVLDEADRMLDMGFLPDVRKILAKLPTQRQTLFFSATMPPAITELSRSILKNPVRVEVTPPATTAERVTQRVAFLGRDDKRELLEQILRDPRVDRALVFTRTKHGANRVVERLEKSGIASAALHGNKSQNARQRALDGFRSGEMRVLVATDIAARGLDVEGVSHVINYDLPDPEAYVHRIGRTARAGKDGLAVTFVEAEEIGDLRAIERTIGQTIPVAVDRIGVRPEDGRQRTSNNRPPSRGGGGGGGGGGRGGGRRR